MRVARYAIGDRVVLKSGSGMRTGQEAVCRVSAVLPAAYGQNQYRVRYENETFDRRIVDTDIDPERSERATKREEAAPPGKGSSWLNPASMKIGK